MQTRAQEFSACSLPPEMLVPPVRPNACRLCQLVHRSILNMEERETKNVLTELHRQAVMRIRKMLETMCSEFKGYHYEIVAGLELDEETAQEQVVVDEH